MVHNLKFQINEGLRPYGELLGPSSSHLSGLLSAAALGARVPELHLAFEEGGARAGDPRHHRLRDPTRLQRLHQRVLVLRAGNTPFSPPSPTPRRVARLPLTQTLTSNYPSCGAESLPFSPPLPRGWCVCRRPRPQAATVRPLKRTNLFQPPLVPERWRACRSQGHTIDFSCCDRTLPNGLP